MTSPHRIFTCILAALLFNAYELAEPPQAETTMNSSATIATTSAPNQTNATSTATDTSAPANTTTTTTTVITSTSTPVSTTSFSATTTAIVTSTVSSISSTSDQTRPTDSSSGLGWWLLVALLVTITIVIVAGVIFYRRQKSPYRRFLQNWRARDDDGDNIILQLEQTDITNSQWPRRISFT